MAKISEKITSREITLGDSPSATFHYNIWEADGEDQALEILLSQAPGLYSVNGKIMSMQDYGVVPVPGSVGNLRWDGEISYDTSQSTPEVGDEPAYSFSTSGDTEHFNTSYKTESKHAIEGMKPLDLQQSIGVTKDGIEGVDILVPTFSFSETHYLADNQVTDTFKKGLRDLTGTVNEETFRTFPKGEVRFDGASGSKRSVDDWEITYNFSCKQNVTNDPRFPTMVPKVDHKGWEYVWAQYVESIWTVSPTEKYHIMKPIRAYVEKVYKLSSFAALGIG